MQSEAGRPKRCVGLSTWPLLLLLHPRSSCHPPPRRIPPTVAALSDTMDLLLPYSICCFWVLSVLLSERTLGSGVKVATF